MKKILILIISILSILGIGIMLIITKGNSDDIVQNKTQDEEEQTVNYKNYLIEKYGIEENELDGIDVVRFFQDYAFDKLEYSKEDVQEILEDQRMYYIDDGSTEIYSILSKEGHEKLDVDSISKIGIHFNIGTRNTKYVFDLVNNCYYEDDVVKNTLSSSQEEALLSLIKNNDILLWEKDYSGEEKESTGNIAWKIVVEDQNGNVFSSGGYTSDGSHLPMSFDQFYEDIQNLLE